jgi:hypothetical protein
MTKLRTFAVVVVMLCGAGVSGTAFASDYTGANTNLVTTPPTTVGAAVLGRAIAAPVPAAPAAVLTTNVATASKTSTLPFTGGDVGGLVLLGLGLVGGGVVLVRRSRAEVARP